MTNRYVLTKTELLNDIEHNWTALTTALDRLTEAQLTTIPDAQGWTIKDHIIHMARWERSVVFFLQHLPRHQSLGIEESLYRKGSEQAVNAAIYQKTRNLPLNEALIQLRETHHQLLELLEPLTDDDLKKHYRDYLPDEPGEGDGPPAINLIYDNTANHFAEHLEWITALIRKPG